MSSKSTLFLTNDNEHWYIEGSSKYYEGTKEDDAMVLEIDAQHITYKDYDGGLIIVLEKSSNLYRKLLTLFYERIL